MNNFIDKVNCYETKTYKAQRGRTKTHPLYGIGFGVYLILIVGWFGIIKALGDMRVSLVGLETTVMETYFTKGSALFLIGLAFVIYLVVVVGMTLFALSKSAAFVNFSVLGVFLMWATDLLLVSKIGGGLSSAISHPLVIFKGVASLALAAYVLSSEKISVTYLGVHTQKNNA